MTAPYVLPPDATAEELVEIHNEILWLNPEIRVHTRWGPATEYSIECTLADAQAVVAIANAPESLAWRIVFGWTPEGPTVDVQWWLESAWRSIFETLPHPADEDEIADRALAWLDAKLPVAAVLMEIDRRIIRAATA